MFFDMQEKSIIINYYFTYSNFFSVPDVEKGSTAERSQKILVAERSQKHDC